jgi:two-component system, LytTR family, response regulator
MSSGSLKHNPARPHVLADKRHECLPLIRIKWADIDWIEAAGNYMTLHAGKESHMVRTTMNALEPRLDPAQFVRIHRCSIVNSDRVREMQPLFRGEHVLILKDGARLNVGRAFRARLLQQMGSIVS